MFYVVSSNATLLSFNENVVLHWKEKCFLFGQGKLF